ncbi:hypothetical protein RB11065 [Rhodopirellula baltica SH 1]|uniref:Uncharacterized protein n=1 Tax=Rhodopirellula baltica (strain DSM 10527 / NCIMB 13988 / SH1) TaxID=243090 RepID=Q7UJU0_RHOBA|nr:hypothetical protein RB11065 [Rhodopirellula baltica SH 1]
MQAKKANQDERTLTQQSAQELSFSVCARRNSEDQNHVHDAVSHENDFPMTCAFACQWQMRRGSSETKRMDRPVA